MNINTNINININVNNNSNNNRNNRENSHLIEIGYAEVVGIGGSWPRSRMVGVRAHSLAGVLLHLAHRS